MNKPGRGRKPFVALKLTDQASFAKYKRKIQETLYIIGLQYKVTLKKLKDKIYFVRLLAGSHLYKTQLKNCYT